MKMKLIGLWYLFQNLYFGLYTKLISSVAFQPPSAGTCRLQITKKVLKNLVKEKIQIDSAPFINISFFKHFQTSENTIVLPGIPFWNRKLKHWKNNFTNFFNKEYWKKNHF